MQEYVAGFAFDYALDEVLLVRKQRPQWQAGKLNAIGGKIEPGERPLDAMRREFTEETTLNVFDWEMFCVLRGDGFVVHFFAATKPCSYLQGFKSPDEPIEIHNSDGLRGPSILPNTEA